MFSAIRNTTVGAAALGLCAGLVLPAQAAYVASLEQVGSNVVATGSGSIDTTDLIFLDNLSPFPLEVEAVVGYLGLGQGPTVAVYADVSGPASFGPGGIFAASTSSGAIIAIEGTSPALGVPENYVSGTALGTSSDTWDGTTLAALGVTDGTYVWHWGSGVDADSYTLQIGPAAVPEPASLTVLAMGLPGLGMVLRTRRA